VNLLVTDATRAYPVGRRALTWIYGRAAVGLQTPGNRLIVLDGVTRTVSSVGGNFIDAWTLLNQLDVAMTASSWDVNITGSTYTLGRTGVTRTVTWLDRLGWLLGFDAEPGDTELPAELIAPRAASPIMVPLMSCEREPMLRDQERKLVLDRFGRGFGYVFGDAPIYRYRVLLDRVGFTALKAGWVLGGARVTLSPYTLAEHIAGTVTAFGDGSPIGYQRGRILGVEGGDWIDKDGPQNLYQCSLIVAAEVT
jgi:hypothetical protein